VERFVSCEPSRRSEYFQSAKTLAPIPVARPLIRTALIQFTLDANVRRIEFVSSVAVQRETIALDSIVLMGEDGAELLEFPEVAATRDLDETGLVLLAIEQLQLPTRRVTFADIKSEPRAANCQMVWACRHWPVMVDDRIRVLDVLGEEGPLPLSRAAAVMRFSRGAISAVLALVCADLIEIELGEMPLAPETVVRRRRPFNKE
jgi:hypothetical protein